MSEVLREVSVVSEKPTIGNNRFFENLYQIRAGFFKAPTPAPQVRPAAEDNSQASTTSTDGGFFKNLYEKLGFFKSPQPSVVPQARNRVEEFYSNLKALDEALINRNQAQFSETYDKLLECSRSGDAHVSERAQEVIKKLREPYQAQASSYGGVANLLIGSGGSSPSSAAVYLPLLRMSPVPQFAELYPRTESQAGTKLPNPQPRI